MSAEVICCRYCKFWHSTWHNKSRGKCFRKAPAPRQITVDQLLKEPAFWKNDRSLERVEPVWPVTPGWCGCGEAVPVAKEYRLRVPIKNAISQSETAVINRLKAHNVVLISDALKLGKRKLLKLKGVGAYAIGVIEDALRSTGIVWQDECPYDGS